jgi:Fe2+ transport system protein B
MILNNNQKHSIWAWLILAFAIAICLSSCSSRKVNKSDTKIVETTKSEATKIDSSKTVILTDTNTKIIDSSSSEEFTIVPIDESKEMVVEGKKYLNSVIKHKKVKNNIVADNHETIAKISQNNVKTTNKAQSSKDISIENKETERKSGFPWWILILIAVAGVCYFGYRKFKGLPFV